VDTIEFPDCPDWVPTLVLDAAKELLLLPLRDHEKLRICRLITDRRMKTVWQTLGQRSRKEPRRYTHYNGPDWPEAWEGLQQHRMKELFIATAAGLYYNQRPVSTRRELAKLRKPFFDTVARLKQAKESLRSLGIGRQNEIVTIDHLILECEMQADSLGHGWIIVDRKVGDPQIRGYLQKLAEIMQRRFGSPMYGVAASIASVALEKKITAAMVREAAGA
jgi:hypothetical protein